jgi:hypothetical protein
MTLKTEVVCSSETSVKLYRITLRCIPEDSDLFETKFLTLGEFYLLEYSISRILFSTCFMLVFCLDYSSTLKKEATCFSEMSVDFQLTTRHYTPEDTALPNHRCQNLQNYIPSRYFSNVASSESSAK